MVLQKGCDKVPAQYFPAALFIEQASRRKLAMYRFSQPLHSANRLAAEFDPLTIQLCPA
jgi:hypothetical protein